MTTAILQVTWALGSGIGTAVIFFPVTYLAMREQFTFRGGLGKAGLPFFYSVVALAILQIFGVSFSPTDSVFGLLMFIVVPICVCALILYFSYRIPDQRSS